MKDLKDFGLREGLQELGAYIFGDGNVPFVPYQPDSDWTPAFVQFENQSLPDFETLACTCFTVTTQIEMQEKRLYGVENNYSDRWLAIVSGLDGKKGTDPQVVYEAVRKYGLIPERMLPFTHDIDTAEEYFSFKGADKEACIAEGKRWLAENEFKHDWLWKGTRPQNFLEIIKSAQQTSTIGLSVSAWNEENGEYVSYGDVNNHYTLGVRFVDGKEQVFDTYKRGNTNLKTLSKDHNIRRAKRIYLNKRTKSAMNKHIFTLGEAIKYLRDFLLKKKR